MYNITYITGYNIVIHNFEGYISNILNAYTGKMIVQILSLISFL